MSTQRVSSLESSFGAKVSTWECFNTRRELYSGLWCLRFLCTSFEDGKISYQPEKSSNKQTRVFQGSSPARTWECFNTRGQNYNKVKAKRNEEEIELTKGDRGDPKTPTLNKIPHLFEGRGEL